MRPAGGTAWSLSLRNFPLDELVSGLAAGALALVAASVQPRRHAVHIPVAGLVMTAATLAAISRTWSVVPGALLGLVGVAATLAWLDRRRPRCGPSFTTAPALIAPFAAVLAVDASPTGWVRGLVGAAVLLGAPAAAQTEAAWGDAGLPPVLYAITAAGVFAAVPDTEQAAVLLGASVPLGLAGWPLRHVRLGPAGAGAAVALLVWVAAVGGRGREPSIVGAVACLGLLVTLPVGGWRAPRAGRGGAVGRSHHVAFLVVGVHLAVVAVASRVAGISSDLDVAAPVAAATVLATLAAGAWLGGTRR
jgi:hypothetical protein